jgi:ferric enterobactin receptor
MMRKYFISYCMVCLILFTGINQAMAQEPVISVSADRMPLSEVLTGITDAYGIRFAFDHGSFTKMESTCSFEKITLTSFLEYLNTQHYVNSNLIDGTWVLLIRDKEVPRNLPAIVQSPNLSGFVHDKKTGEALLYCNVVINNRKGGTTNELGFFNFDDTGTDPVHILVSYLGYERFDTVVSPGNLLRIGLKPASIVLKSVKVLHYEQDVFQAFPQNEKIAFNPIKSAHIPRIANDDLGNALLLIPGIDFHNGGSSGLSIRGGDPADNIVLFDGIPVLETSHLLGNMSVLNAKFVQQAFVSRGGFDASYGGRVAGLIELTGKSGRKNKPNIDLSANLLNTNVVANVPLTDKFSVTAAWRRSFIDKWQNYLYFRLIDDVVSSDDNPVTSTIFPVVKFQDVNAKISFHPSEKLTFDLNILYGKDEQSRDFELLQTKEYYRNESLWSENLGMSLNWNWQANNRWFHSFSAGFSTLEKDVVDETGELHLYTEPIQNPGKSQGKGKGLAVSPGRTFTRETHDIDNGFNQTSEYRAEWKSRVTAGKSTVEAGLGMTSGSYSYRFYTSRLDESLQTDSLANSASLHLVNAFVQQHLELPWNFRVRMGLRVNLNPESNAAYYQPRGGLEYAPGKHFRLYALSGVYYQFLSGIRRFDSDGHFSRLWYLPGKDGAGVVSGQHYILGFKLEKNGWFADVEAYRKTAEGKVNLFADYNQSGSNRTVYYTPRESREETRGLDMFIQKRHLIFNHMAGYSISSSKERMDGFFGDEWFPAYNDRTHRLKLTEMIKYKGWTLTGDWQFASGLPVLKFVPDQPLEDFDRSGFFSQLNAALVKTISGDFYTFSGGASLLNIFDRQNIVEVNYLRFSSDTGSMTVRSDISALGFTPVFFINVEF